MYGRARTGAYLGKVPVIISLSEGRWEFHVIALDVRIQMAIGAWVTVAHCAPRPSMKDFKNAHAVSGAVLYITVTTISQAERSFGSCRCLSGESCCRCSTRRPKVNCIRWLTSSVASVLRAGVPADTIVCSGPEA